MVTGASRTLDIWASAPGFRAQTLDEAASSLHELLPDYPGPADQPKAICVNGFRWFNEEMEAVADAIHRSHKRPHLGESTLATKDWDVTRSSDGLWAVPGRSSTRRCTELWSDVEADGAGTTVVRRMPGVL